MTRRVTLCGSTRFREAFEQAFLDEALAGNVVFTVGVFRHSHPVPHEVGEVLDQMHLRKIDISDEILVLNVGGYIGEGTRREIAYATRHGKTVRWLQPDMAVKV